MPTNLTWLVSCLVKISVGLAAMFTGAHRSFSQYIQASVGEVLLNGARPPPSTSLSTQRFKTSEVER
jgi:hypothetical protein